MIIIHDLINIPMKLAHQFKDVKIRSVIRRNKAFVIPSVRFGIIISKLEPLPADTMII